MLLNLPNHLNDTIQLGKGPLQTLAFYKFYGVIHFFQNNLQPQPNKITDYYDHSNIWTINGASAKGCLHVLEWWKNSRLELKYDRDAIYCASMNGLLKVLEWWKNSGLELKYDLENDIGLEYEIDSVIDYASKNHHPNVLEWWKNSGLKLKYTSETIDKAFESRNSTSIRWWLSSGLDLKNPKYPIDYMRKIVAEEEDQKEDFFKKYGCKKKYRRKVRRWY